MPRRYATSMLARLRRSRPGWLTLETVAKLMSTRARPVQRDTVYRLERGMLRVPEPWILDRYAHALGVPLDWVVTRLQPLPPRKIPRTKRFALTG